MTTTRDAPQPSDMQRVDEWAKLSAADVRYHTAQWESPKQSTLAFEEFAAHRISRSSNIIDMGAGAGAATAYLAQRHRSVNFTGFDYSAELVSIAQAVAAGKGLGNVSFTQGDWFALEPSSAFDGVISLQTLSWLPEAERPLLEIFGKFEPRWIALTSLFHEGDITCRIEVEEHVRQRKTNCNVYSLPALGRLCEANGYRLEKFAPFEIGIDLDKPLDRDQMGTYTRKVLRGDGPGFERMQFSGPLLMSWYMVLIEKA